MPGLTFDLLARDKASPAITRLGGAFDKAAVGQTKFTSGALRAAEMSNKLRVSELQVAAATERHALASKSASASVARQAQSEIALIRANEGLAAAQRESAVAAAMANKASVAAGAGAAAGLGRAVKMAGSLGLVIGGIELGKKAVEFVGAGKDLTTSLNSVQAAANATDAQMVGVRKQVIGMGKDLRIPGATAVDAADAIDDLVRAGVKLPRAVQAARPALLLAASANVKTADSARVLGDVMDEFRLPATQAGKVANTLAAAANSAGGGLMDLFDGFKYAGPSARALGLDVNDTAASLVMLAKSGLQGSLGGTATARMLARLAPTSGTASAALKDLEVNAFNAKGQFIGLPKVLDQLHEAQERLSPKQFAQDVQMAFGDRAKNAVYSFAHGGAAAWLIWANVVKKGNVQKYADLQNRGVAAGFRQLTKEATSAGIDVYAKIEPGINGAVQLVGKALPAAFHLAGMAAKPFITAWDGLSVILGPPLHLLGDVLGVLKPVGPVLGGTAAGVLALWAAWKGYQIASVAASAVKSGIISLTASARGGVLAAGDFATRWVGAMTGSTAASARAEAAAAQQAGVMSRSAANAAAAQVTMARAIGTASESAIASMNAVALAAERQALNSEAAAVTTIAAAESTALGVTESGAAASLGWKSMLGPMVAVGLGITLLTGLFHKSDSASKQATGAAKAYSDAMASTDNVTQALAGTLTKQLTDNNVADHINDLNKNLGHSAVTGKQFFSAIMSGAAGNEKPLEKYRSKLQAVIDAANPKSSTRTYSTQGILNKNVSDNAVKNGERAKKVLDDLNAQWFGVSDAERKAITNAKAFGQVATPIEQVTKSTKVGTETAKTYAAMVGLVADKSGVFYESQRTVTGAVDLVANTYNTATQSTAEYLDAIQTFSKSAGTAADRASLIGSMLKAANGDALGYAGAMATAADASRTFRSDVASAAKQVGKNGISTRSYLKSIIDLKKGTIDYKAQGAGPLISDLQGMQSAAMNAAQATFQHSRSMKDGKRSADDAYNVYKRMTSDGLVKQARALGLTKREAQGLARQYFGMPKNVKTKIESAGTDPILTVLNKIGEQLGILTGHPWNTKITADASDVGNKVGQAKDFLAELRDKHITITTTLRTRGAADHKATDPRAGGNETKRSPGGYTGGMIDHGAIRRATGGGIGLVRGPGTATSDDVPAYTMRGGRVQPYRLSDGEYVIREKMTRKHRHLIELINEDKLPALAKGGHVGNVHAVRGGWAFDGKFYTTEKSAKHAHDKAAYETHGDKKERPASGVYRVGKGYGYEGSYYSSAKDANAARRDDHRQTAAAARYHSPEQYAAVRSDTASYRSAIGSSDLESTKSAYQSLYADAKAAGASRTALAALARQEKTVIADLKARTVASERAAKVQDRLNDLVSKSNDLRSSVRSAFTGSFDITQSSPQMFNDVAGGGSAGAILKSLQAKASKAAAYRSLLTRLGKAGLNKAMLQQLAEAGPTVEAFNAAQALSKATPKELAGINSQAKALSDAGAGAGSYVANAVFGSQIAVSKALLNGYSPKKNPHMAKAVKDLAKAMFGAGKVSGVGLEHGLLGQKKSAGDAAWKLGKTVEQQLKKSLHIHSPSRVMIGLGQQAGLGFALGLAEHADTVAAAASDLGDAAVPSVPSSRSGRGGGDTYVDNSYVDNRQYVVNEAEGGMDVVEKLMRRQQMAGRP